MHTFLFIVLVTPWSLITLLAWKFWNRPKIYGKFWLVPESYLDAYDYSKEPPGEVNLIVVKQTDAKQKQLKKEFKNEANNHD